MILYVEADILQFPQDVAVVNTVNIWGVMGKGLAKQVREKWQEVYVAYKTWCDNRMLQIGVLQPVLTLDGRWVINFPTKKHWRNDSEIHYIKAGLETFVKHFTHFPLVAFPRLGCGCGNLQFEADVKPLMEQFLSPLTGTYYICSWSGHAQQQIRDHSAIFGCQPERLQ